MPTNEVLPIRTKYMKVSYPSDILSTIAATLEAPASSKVSKLTIGDE